MNHRRNAPAHDDLWTEGRPIRSPRGRAVLPELSGLDNDVAIPHAAQAWLQASLLEYSSIAGFTWVARSLECLGAPIELVRRAEHAAEDERHHAKICLDIAHEVGAPEARIVTDVDSLAALRNRTDDLSTTARSALLDGVVAEGFAAARLQRTAVRCERDAHSLAAQLRRLADDELRHANFARDVIAWCVSVRPWIVDELALALDDLDERPHSSHLDSVADSDRTAAGLCTDADADAAWTEILAGARELVASSR